MKTCTKCGKTKPLSAFHKNRMQTSGRSSACAKCLNAQRKESYAAGRIAPRKYRRSARIAAFEKFGPNCNVCKKVLTIDTMCVDHDHKCHPKNYCDKCTRGILCARCNLALGHLNDSVVLLTNAIEYLEKTGLDTSAQT